jgi:FKBP-type peptidyl-prolyl cis-trans isomerase (trigger factor)
MANTQKGYKNVKLSPLPERELEIIGTIPAEKMAEMRTKALAKLKADIEIPGFRKGNAPDAVIAQKIGEGRLLEEAAEIALSEEYPNILEEHKVDAIGRPEIQITKLGVGSDMEFKIKTSLYPDVKLSEYKKTAKKEMAKDEKPEEASEKEIDDVIKNLRVNLAHQKLHEDIGHDNHDHAPIKDEDLPVVDDSFVKLFGNFKDVADFKNKIKENIEAEKKLKAKDKKRTNILESIIESSTIDLPKIIIDGEMEKMLAQFKDDVAKSGISYEEYLKHIKKTEEDLKKDWNETAVKRAKSQIILNTIAKEEGIAPEEEEVKKEMENILAHYKDAERFRVRMYVETFMTNELVFQFLEKQ